MAEPAYLRDGTAIYQRSFAIIRAEADLERFSPDEAEVAVRMIHACGLVEAARYIEFGHGLVAAARSALAQGAPILCDAEMVAHGVTRARSSSLSDVPWVKTTNGCLPGRSAYTSIASRPRGNDCGAGIHISFCT